MKFLFDLGGVFFDWDPNHFFKDIFDKVEEREYFLTEVCNDEWNIQQDAGRTIKEAEAVEPTRWTWSHFRHHSNTASIKDPHDYEAALFHGYPSLSSFLFSFVPFAELIRFKHSWKFETIKHALGLTTPVMKDCIPENEIWKCRLISRIHVGIWIMSFILSFYLMNPLP